MMSMMHNPGVRLTHFGYRANSSEIDASFAVADDDVLFDRSDFCSENLRPVMVPKKNAVF